MLDKAPLLTSGLVTLSFPDGGDGGDRRDRTDDLKLAKLPLSQLSYVPIFTYKTANAEEAPALADL